MKTRSELRQISMNILYQLDILKTNEVDFQVEEIISDNLDVDNEFVRNIVYGVITHQDQIDELANKYLKDWPINRIDKAGAAILRIGIYELLYLDDVPPIVSIDEAVELAKQFCDENVKKIVNAVLDKIANE